jgi:hypothetical protein
MTKAAVLVFAVVGAATLGLSVAGAAPEASRPGPSPSPVTRYIETYNPPATAYTLIRGGKMVSIRIWLPLRDGDCVRLAGRNHNGPDREADASIVMMIDGHEERVDAQQPEYCVQRPVASGSLRAIGAEMFSLVEPLFSRAQYDYDHVVTTAGRNDTEPVPPSLPLLRGDQGRIVAGTRALSVAWRNGTAPYRVRLYREGRAQPLAEQATVTVHRLRLYSLSFTPDAYRLEVTDARGNTAAARFEAVPKTSLPTLPPDDAAALADQSQPAGFRAACYAAWLVQQDAAWKFEGYQGIAEHVGDSDLARLLTFELTEGD